MDEVEKQVGTVWKEKDEVRELRDTRDFAIRGTVMTPETF